MKPISNTPKDIIAREEVQEASNPTFTEASERTNIASGESLPTLFGKIKKFFSDLKTVAFSGSYADLSGTENVAYKNANNQFSADQTIDKQDGTTSDLGFSALTLGNNIAQGTVKNSRGQITLMGTGTSGTVLISGNPTATRVVELPNKSGTVALTTDIPDISTKVSKSGDTMSGHLTVDLQDGGADQKDAWSCIALGNSIAKGTAKHSAGYVRLYGHGSYYTDLTAENSQANRFIHFPDKSGTVALTSDNCASAFTLFSGETGSTSYASNDSHIMLLCTITLGDYYEYLSLLITSSFWGNQHGSADIINIQASIGQSSSVTPFTIYRVSLGGYGGNGNDRIFYYGSSGNTVYLYVYVTGGNGYGGWNISCLKQRNCSYVFNGTKNVSPSSMTPISLGGRINYAERANSDDEGNRFVISYGASLGYSNGVLYLYNKNGTKISQVTISTSSRKFKRNIEPLSETEARKILDIETVTFDYTKEKDNYTSRKGYKNIGCIAEDVNEIIPELVIEDDEGNVYGVNYLEMIPYLIKMCQIQQEEINSFKEEITELKKLIPH